jgi:hypothetical protein
MPPPHTHTPNTHTPALRRPARPALRPRRGPIADSPAAPARLQPPWGACRWRRWATRTRWRLWRWATRSSSSPPWWAGLGLGGPALAVGARRVCCRGLALCSPHRLPPPAPPTGPLRQGAHPAGQAHQAGRAHMGARTAGAGGPSGSRRPGWQGWSGRRSASSTCTAATAAQRQQQRLPQGAQPSPAPPHPTRLPQVSKYARGGHVRKQSARKFYNAVDAIIGHFAANGCAAGRPAAPPCQRAGAALRAGGWPPDAAPPRPALPPAAPGLWPRCSTCRSLPPACAEPKPLNPCAGSRPTRPPR